MREAVMNSRYLLLTVLVILTAAGHLGYGKIKKKIEGFVIAEGQYRRSKKTG